MSLELRGDLGTLRLRWWHERADAAAGSLLDFPSAVALIRSAMAHPGNAHVLRRAVAEADPGRTHLLEEREVVDEIHRLIRTGRLGVILQPPPVMHVPQLKTLPDEPAILDTPTELETTWIEIQLVDQSCRPVPGERYEVTLPDGALVKGRLNDLGRVRVQDIPNIGDCKVTFPDLDKDAWHSDVKCPEAKPIALEFVEFELLDMSGEPVPREPYQVTFKDGTVCAGRLNEAGRIRFEGVPPGDCKITFPNLDAEAWEAFSPE